MFHKQLGISYMKIGKIMPTVESILPYAIKAKKHFYKAMGLNPYDAESAYFFAKEAAWIEKINLKTPSYDNTKGPDLLPYFKKAVQLRPSSMQYHYALAKYLYQINHYDELKSEIKKMVTIYPYSYNNLKKEPFWSEQFRDDVYSGLYEAAKIKGRSWEAYHVLSSLKAEEGKWPDALKYYQEGLKYKKIVSMGDEIQVARLYLKNNLIEEAQKVYSSVFYRYKSKPGFIKLIYNDYKKEGLFNELYNFYKIMNIKFYLSPHIEIFMSRVMIDLKRLDDAKEILTRLNDKKPQAEAYYWLYRIHEINKDPDNMELAIQKATLHDPYNKQYHKIFANVLRLSGKTERALKEAELAR